MSWLREPRFMKTFHAYASVAWFVASFPLAWYLGSSVVFVTFLSLYAIVTGHWSAWQSTRVEVKQEQQLEGLGETEQQEQEWLRGRLDADPPGEREQPDLSPRRRRSDRAGDHERAGHVESDLAGRDVWRIPQDGAGLRAEVADRGRGDVDVEMLTALGVLRIETARAMDRAQVGAPEPEDDPMSAAMTRVASLRIARMLKGEM